MWHRRADNWSRNDGILQHPGQRDLRHRDAASLRNLLYSVDDRPITVAEEPPAHGVGVGALGMFAPGSGKPSFCQRTPRNAAYALVGEEAEHLPLFLTLHQVVLVLHGNEPRPAVQIREIGRASCRE